MHRLGTQHCVAMGSPPIPGRSVRSAPDTASMTGHRAGRRITSSQQKPMTRPDRIRCAARRAAVSRAVPRPGVFRDRLATARPLPSVIGLLRAHCTTSRYVGKRGSGMPSSTATDRGDLCTAHVACARLCRCPGASHRLTRPGESKGPPEAPGRFTTAGWPRSPASKIGSWTHSAVRTTRMSAKRNSLGHVFDTLLHGDERRRAEGELFAAQAHTASASCLDVSVPVGLTPERARCPGRCRRLGPAARACAVFPARAERAAGIGGYWRRHRAIWAWSAGRQDHRSSLDRQ